MRNWGQKIKKKILKQSKTLSSPLGKKINKYINIRTLLLGLIMIVLFLAWKNYFKGVALLLVLFPFQLYAVRVTRFVNYVTLEIHSATAILMGYLFGPVVGFIVGFTISNYGYLMNSITKLTSFTDCFLTGLLGFLTGYMLRNSFSFSTAFVVGIIIKNFVGFLVYLVIDPDKVQNVVYRTTHVFWNVFIVRMLFGMIYSLYNLI